MATLKFNVSFLSEILVYSSLANAEYAALLGYNSTNMNNSSFPLRCLLGAGNTGSPYSALYVFKGSIPSDFDTFTSISTRIDDLLIVLPTNGSGVSPVGISGDATTGSVARGAFSIPNRTTYTLMSGSSSYTFARTSNVTTLTMPSNQNHILLPGQSITVSGNSNSTFNGTFTVSTVVSSTVITYTNNGPDVSSGSLTSTITTPLTARASGTASWFCLCRTPSTFTTESLFTGFGAMIGTVGATGSGSDLEMASTTVTAGNYYASQGLYLTFPASWDVP